MTAGCLINSLREQVANEFETLYGRISGLQRDLISQGGIAFVDDMEAAAIKIRQFIDRIKTASYGYSGIFDALKIKEDKLALVYEYDAALLGLSDQVSSAIDNVEASMGTDGLDAAIRHLVTVSQQCVDAFNKRSEVMKDIAAE